MTRQRLLAAKIDSTNIHRGAPKVLTSGSTEACTKKACIALGMKDKEAS